MEKDDWSSSWRNKVYCSNCGGMFELKPNRVCSVCGQEYIIRKYEYEVDGKIIETYDSFAGAIPWTTHVLLKLMQEEWKRPFNTELHKEIYFKTSPRVIIVLLFWTQFETLIEQLLTTGMRKLPKNVGTLLLNKHPQISSRLDVLYPLVFESSLSKDLINFGYKDLDELIKEVRVKRNDFLHGRPETIDEDVVHRVVAQVQNMQEAWIKIYNHRCTDIK